MTTPHKNLKEQAFEEHIEKLKEYRSSLIYSAVTGR